MCMCMESQLFQGRFGMILKQISQFITSLNNIQEMNKGENIRDTCIDIYVLLNLASLLATQLAQASVFMHLLPRAPLAVYITVANQITCRVFFGSSICVTSWVFILLYHITIQ